MKTNPRTVAGSMPIAALLAAALLYLPVSCAHNPAHHPSHDHADHAAMPSSYADAIEQIRSRMASVRGIIASEDYDKVHDDAEAIGQTCGSLEQLAAAPGSGVPREQVAAVARRAKELADASDAMHDAAHDGNTAKVKEHFAHMDELLDALAQARR